MSAYVRILRNNICNGCMCKILLQMMMHSFMLIIKLLLIANWRLQSCWFNVAQFCCHQKKAFIELGMPSTTLTETINMLELEQIILVWYNFVNEGCRCWKMCFWNVFFFCFLFCFFFCSWIKRLTSRDMWPFTQVWDFWRSPIPKCTMVPVLFQ